MIPRFVSTQLFDIWHLIAGKSPYLGLLNGDFIRLMLCCLITGEKLWLDDLHGESLAPRFFVDLL